MTLFIIISSLLSNLNDVLVDHNTGGSNLLFREHLQIMSTTDDPIFAAVQGEISGDVICKCRPPSTTGSAPTTTPSPNSLKTR